MCFSGELQCFHEHHHSCWSVAFGAGAVHGPYGAEIAKQIVCDVLGKKNNVHIMYMVMFTYVCLCMAWHGMYKHMIDICMACTNTRLHKSIRGCQRHCAVVRNAG